MKSGLTQFSLLTDDELILPFVETKQKDQPSLRRRSLSKFEYSLTVKKFKISKLSQKIKISSYPSSLKSISLTLVNPFNKPVKLTSMLTTLLKIDSSDKKNSSSQSWKFLVGLILVLGGFFALLFVFYRKKRSFM